MYRFGDITGNYKLLLSVLCLRTLPTQNAVNNETTIIVAKFMSLQFCIFVDVVGVRRAWHMQHLIKYA